ncbi:CG42255 [Drosophila busckii]|uniref:CG42255 n=2 Tax=Drosophila busckii TaxID=30019 RepID=A0A0M4EH43_DROBS|nr:CG42255 [Drosophila busckii]
MSGDAINCIWRVQAPPQHAIYLSFKRFQLVESMHCDFAHLSVYKGFVESVPQRVARLCRNLTDTIVMVDNNQALIHANLPSYGDGLGFLASVKFTPNCNERLVLGEGNERMSLTRHFSRRGVNGSSSEQLLCYFRASGTPGQRLSVWLKTLSLNQRLCRTCSALELIDGFDSNSASLGRYYGVVGNGSRFFSTGSDVLIKLTSELTLPLSSDIEFEIVIELAPTVCGQLDYDLRLNDTVKLSLHSGNISSSYGSVHCTWHIKSDQQLELQLVSLQLQSVSQVTGKCIDYLQLSVPFESAKYFCGRSNSTVLYLSNDFDLTFHTQDQESSFDFDIIIRQKTTCNRTHNALSGLIDYNIKDLGYCYQDLLVPQDYFLTLHIYYLSFNAAENNITFNLTDLMTNSTIRSIRSEPQFQMDIDVYAKTNALRLLGRGAHMLRLFYYATPRQLRHGCGGNINTLEGRLMNPNYNNRNYSECIWHLISPAGNNFQFALSEFNMGSDVNCPLDYVKFYEVEPDNSEKLRNSFCGQHEFQVVRINAHHIKIVAKKSPNFDGTGFHIDFSPSG